MSEYKSKITRDEYLKTLALATMANGLSIQCYALERAMNKIVRPGSTEFDGGHLGDAIYSTEPITVAIVDEALKREGIEVVDDPQT